MGNLGWKETMVQAYRFRQHERLCSSSSHAHELHRAPPILCAVTLAFSGAVELRLSIPE